MNTYTLYIDDNLADLPTDQKVSINIQRVDFGELSTRKVSRTDRMVLPITENNNRIFGNSNDVKSTSGKPYDILPARLLSNGVDMFPRGICYLLEVNQKGYSIVVLENLFDIFQILKGKFLSYVSPINPSAWTGAGRDAARTNTSGIISAIVNWGRPGGIYQADNYLPCFYYHSIIRSILESTGLTLSGDILTDTDFTELAVPFAGETWEYNIALSEIVDTSVEAPLSSYPTNATGDHIQFSEYTMVDRDLWDFPSYQFVNTNVNTISVTIAASVDFTNISWDIIVLTDYFRVRLAKVSNGVKTYIDNSGILVCPVTFGNCSVGAPTTMLNGDTFHVELEFFVTGGNPSFDYEATCTTVFNSTPDISNVIWNLLFPEVTVDSILADFTNRFGIVYRQINNNLYIKTLDEICRDQAGAVDWTAKRTKNEPDISFKTSYAKENTFNHSDSIENPGTGRGTINIDNDILSAIRNVFTSVFCNSTTSSFSGGYFVADMDVYDADSTTFIQDFANAPRLRIVTLKARTAETAITFDAVPRTDYKLGYFVDPNKVKDTSFNYFVRKYYPSLSNALQKNKIVTHLYNLSETDIASYNPHKMIFDDGNYYLINRIVNYMPGRITEVELFKIL